MTNSLENHLIEPTESAPSPGLQLRNSRENRRLSIEAVAAELHVVPKVIAALEADDFGQLPSAVFVRGYLRNYARLLNLPPEPLIATYNRIAGIEPVLVAAPVRDEVNDDRQLRWGKYLSGLGALILVVFWISSGINLRFWDVTQPTIEPTTVTGENPPPASVQQASTQPPPSLETKPVTAQAPHPQPPQTGMSEAVTANAAAAPVMPTTSPTAPNTTPTPATTQVAPTPETGQGPDLLTVRLAADSWVAIRDAGGQRLVYATLTSGSIRSVRGQAPFALVIGNSPAAQIEFNGQPVDHGKFTKGLVARFKVAK